MNKRMPQPVRCNPALVHRVLRTIKKNRMVNPGDHVLAAVSGGADSVAMLHLLVALQERLGIGLSVAHMDHMLRGEAAQRESAFVHELASGLGLACICEARDVRAHKAACGLSLQEAAREVRYQFFRDAMAATGATRLALAHQADDQAETILMRLVRGSSLKGLAGIPACRDGFIIRPLIEVQRRDIEDYLRELGIAFVADSSAGEQHYLRNRVRHGLLPLLRREYNPNIVATLGRTAQLMRQDDRVLEALAHGVLSGNLVLKPDQHIISVAALRQAGPDLQGRLVRRIMAGLKGDMRALTERHIEAVVRLIEKPGPSRTVQLPGPWCVRRQYGNLIFARRADALAPFYYKLESVPASMEIPQLGLTLRFAAVQIDDPRTVFENKDPQVAYMSIARAIGPVTVRRWEPGDAFHPLGARGTRKLKDLFSDLKIPLLERRRVPVLLFGGQIAWVCGLRLDERFKVLQAEQTALKVTLESMVQI